MSTMKVCVLFRPLNSKELSEFGDAVSVQGINSESFIIKVLKLKSLFCVLIFLLISNQM